MISPSSYLPLGDSFYQAINPTPVADPRLLLFNESLAQTLDCRDLVTFEKDELAQLFSGNKLVEGNQAIALAYCGHQFGQFNPQLGDGRAHVIGETKDESGQVFDIQLKGSGVTRFSRQGDGRCAIGPAIREYIMSEAMAALNVTTTRCLSVVSTGETVFRTTAQLGAVVTRIASSHIRVGTFQYFAVREDSKALQQLLTFSIERHYPHIAQQANTISEQALLFLQQVMNKQVSLVVDWLRVGFIHGVMNTDNTAISGETIDYGPCAMINHYDPSTVFSSIDHQGRYAFGNQANIAVWNMARLTEALLPLIDDDSEQAIAKATPLLDNMQSSFADAYYAMQANKLGFSTSSEEIKSLCESLLTQMFQHKLDYTQTFYNLTLRAQDALADIPTVLNEWVKQWQELLHQQSDIESAVQLMQQTNPVVIPRNHHVETIIKAFEDEKTDRFERLQSFMQVMAQPYTLLPHTAAFQDAPEDGDVSYQTFCGT